MSIFNIDNLILAYRKAKVDLYYSTNNFVSQIADYEDDLISNLESLVTALNGSDEEWVTEKTFIGDWLPAAKSISKYSSSLQNSVVFSDPKQEWEIQCESTPEKNKLVAEFRVMSKASIDFHVLSTLWIMQVGHKYDAQLTDCAYGNRLRRGADGKLNSLSLGSFKPYLKPFRDWRNKGIDTMRRALEDKKKVVAVTADISSFYHELNPDFIFNDDFRKVLKIEQNSEEKKLDRLFITALRAWSQNTPLKKGLPVGLPASGVIANIALIELDRIIEQQVVPLYYGRYVDDIILVMENGVDFKSPQNVWEWLFARADNKLSWKDSEKHEGVNFSPQYLSDSRITFDNQKNKIFFLEGASGSTLINSLERQISARSSEWRSLPNLPRDPDLVGTDLICATQNDGEVADNLRKTDALTMRRAGFAIMLRDFEAYERDLPPNAWKNHRLAFFDALLQHVLIPHRLFELEHYLPRVIRLAVSCEDFEELAKIIHRLEWIYKTVVKNCHLKLKSCDKLSAFATQKITKRWALLLSEMISENIKRAYPSKMTLEGRQSWKSHIVGVTFNLEELDIGNVKEEHARLFSYDLAHLPFRFIGLPKEMVSQRGIPSKKLICNESVSKRYLPSALRDGVKALSKLIKCDCTEPHGLVFATRPFCLAELFVLCNNKCVDSDFVDTISSIVLSTRGFNPSGAMPHFDKAGTLQIPFDFQQTKFPIAISSWKTHDDSWLASVKQLPDPRSFDRYSRLTHMVNSFISKPGGARYFILPELSLPSHWFFRFANKLKGRGVSLIAGIEYLHSSKARLRNQVWAALLHDAFGFTSMMVYQQDKQRPAQHEEAEIKRLAAKVLKPVKLWKEPPIIKHGGFKFALLICSELTNISYRSSVRGKADALFIVELNKDSETFNALVESAALDIHAFIIQCNDRNYGDSRIRAPFKDSWRRDLLRIKGGIVDYYVIGEIDITELRRFQSSHRSPSGPFKPVPDGFSISFDRQDMPI